MNLGDRFRTGAVLYSQEFRSYLASLQLRVKRGVTLFSGDYDLCRHAAKLTIAKLTCPKQGPLPCLKDDCVMCGVAFEYRTFGIGNEYDFLDEGYNCPSRRCIWTSINAAHAGVMENFRINVAEKYRYFDDTVCFILRPEYLSKKDATAIFDQLNQGAESGRILPIYLTDAESFKKDSFNYFPILHFRNFERDQLAAALSKHTQIPPTQSLQLVEACGGRVENIALALQTPQQLQMLLPKERWVGNVARQLLAQSTGTSATLIGSPTHEECSNV